MKWLRKIILASFRWLATPIEMTASPYERSPYERPMNRRQRRRMEWQRTHQFSAYWRDIPWYKRQQYMGGWQKIEAEMCKPKKPETVFKHRRYRIRTQYIPCISALFPAGYVVQKRNWRWQWKDVAYFEQRVEAKVFILEQENT